MGTPKLVVEKKFTVMTTEISILSSEEEVAKSVSTIEKFIKHLNEKLVD